MTSIEPSLSGRNLIKLRKRLAILTLSGVVVLLFSFFFIQNALYTSAVERARVQMEATTYRLGMVLLQNQSVDLQQIVQDAPQMTVGLLNSDLENVSGSIPPHLVGDLGDTLVKQPDDVGSLLCMHGAQVMVMAYSKLPILDRVVVTYTPRSTLLKNWRQEVTLHALLLLIALLIQGGLAFWLWQRLKQQHVRASNLADHFSDAENALAECGCAILCWPMETADGVLTTHLNWPKVMGSEKTSGPHHLGDFLDRLTPASRAKVQGPLIDNIWTDTRIGAMVDFKTENDVTQRFYLMAQCFDENERTFISVLLLETAAQQELCHPFETYLHHTPEPSIAIDEDGILRGFSPPLEDLIGPRLLHLIRKPFVELFIPEDQANAQASLRRRIGKRISLDEKIILRVRDRANNIRWLAWHTIGPFDGMTFGSARDVTEFVENANKLRQTADQLKRSNEDLEQFAYVASHDLQQPLRMVASYTQLLKRRYGGTLDHEADEYIDYAVDGAKRMHKLISSLLEYAKTGKNDDFVQIDCNLVLNEAQADLKAFITQEQATIIHDKLPVVMGDRIGLSRLFQNLLSNAIKYRRPGVPPYIEITFEPDQQETDFWRFSIRDNGIGIHPEHAQRIFRLFQRLHKDEFSGTGLGLSLCRKIVEQHGGRIWLDTERSLAEPGTTIIFTLPAHQIS
ncbi:PAS domain-containing protein [Thalassospira sp. MA62]|nr:PAS domain-containing protein [Thalassospira sp. MA62]